MSSYTDRPDEWWFKRQPPGQSHSPGLLQKKTLDRSLDTFVREVLQNINDAGLDNDDPVEVSFRLIEIDDTERDTFEDAICWDSLVEHVRAAAEEQDGPGLEQYLEYLDDGGSVRVLVVEEQNTSGIQGDEVSTDCDYAALVRDPGSSNKGGETGGRHGLGSSVLWVASGLQTVLFNSNLAEERAEQESPRLVGRSFVPTHQTSDGQWYDNEGWFGSPTGFDDPDLERPESIWNGSAEELASRLGISRSDGPGTSTMIVGFRDPSDPSMEEQPSASDVADTFERATAEYFWPAISRGRLSVHIDMLGDERHVSEETIRDYESVSPFVRCYEARAEATSHLGGPGDVASLEFDYEIRSKKQTDTPEEGQISLAVRRAYPDEEERVGEIAMFRGSGMVVKYKPGHHLGFSEKFHGVLACGNARADSGEEPTRSDRAIEEFLSMAEPPAHDDWVGKNNDELKGTYESGCVACVKRLKKDLLRNHLSELLYRNEEKAGESIRPQRAILPKTRRPSAGRRSASTPSIPSPFDWEVTSEFDSGRWRFDGWIEPDVDEDVAEWDAEIEVAAMFEDGREASSIPIHGIRVEGETAVGSVEDGRAILEADGDVRVSFYIDSEVFGDADPRSGSVGETKFKIIDGSIGIAEVAST
jgi:hypothetical protein